MPSTSWQTPGICVVAFDPLCSQSNRTAPATFLQTMGGCQHTLKPEVWVKPRGLMSVHRLLLAHSLGHVKKRCVL